MLFIRPCYAKPLQLCPTLCDPIDSSPPGSLIPGILQARTLEWVAISFSNAWKWKVKVKSLSLVLFLTTPWTAAHQAPPSMGFSRQEYWSGVPLPSPHKTLRCSQLLVSLLIQSKSERAQSAQCIAIKKNNNVHVSAFSYCYSLAHCLPDDRSKE